MNIKFKATGVALAIIAGACGSDSKSDSNQENQKSISTTDKPKSIPSLNIQDPLYKTQWYLKNTGQVIGKFNLDISVFPEQRATQGLDIKIEPVWKKGYTGKGTHIAILDEPFFQKGKENETHEDLKGAIHKESHNYHAFTSNENNHALQVAGIIAARANHLGIRGIAYESQVYAYGILNPKNLTFVNFDEITDAMKKILKIPEISVVNNSWGSFRLTMPAKYQAVLKQGLTTGFGGKGIVYVKSAGNEGILENSTSKGENNYHGFIMVNSIDHQGSNTGGYALNFRSHSNPDERLAVFLGITDATSNGSNLWISAPGWAVITTGGWTKSYKYSAFSATSAAAPIITGVVALMRQANPKLTWRDVKLILAETAEKNDSSHADWQEGYRKKGSSEKYFFNNSYGFGMVNAQKAIELTKKWKNLPDMKTATTSANVDVTISTTFEATSMTIQNSGIDFIESVVVELELEKKINIADSRFFLTLSNGSKESRLSNRSLTLKMDDASGTNIYTSQYHDKNQITLQMLSNLYLGSSADGTWTLKIKDTAVFTKLKKWKLTIRGH